MKAYKIKKSDHHVIPRLPRNMYGIQEGEIICLTHLIQSEDESCFGLDYFLNQLKFDLAKAEGMAFVKVISVFHGGFLMELEQPNATVETEDGKQCQMLGWYRKKDGVVDEYRWMFNERIFSGIEKYSYKSEKSASFANALCIIRFDNADELMGAMNGVKAAKEEFYVQEQQRLAKEREEAEKKRQAELEKIAWERRLENPSVKNAMANVFESLRKH